MQNLKILNKKETKEILSLIEKQWGAKLDLDYVFLRNNKDRIFVVNRDMAEIDTANLRINSLGMYFCEVRNGDIRLSIEGSQIVGKESIKNVVDISEDQKKKWFLGEDLEVEGSYSGFVILKNENDFLGSGKFKEGKVLNYVSKSRRVSAVI